MITDNIEFGIVSYSFLKIRILILIKIIVPVIYQFFLAKVLNLLLF